MPRKWITACPLAFGETSVKQRIKAVLHYKKPTLWIIIAALVICSVLVVCFLTDPVADQPSISATMLFDRDLPDTALQGDVALEGFPGVSIRWSLTPNLITSEEKPILVKDGKESTLFGDYPPPSSLYVADVTGDGKPDLCADVYYFFSGLPSFNAVCVYDIAGDHYYMLADVTNTNHYTKVSYYLRMEEGELVCDKVSVHDESILATGTLFLADTGENMTLCMGLRNAPVAAADIANKQYVYTKPGAGSAFYINIYANGTFQYYAGNYSSHIGLGDWELKDGKLYLYDTTLTNSMTFVFAVGEEQLTYIAAESHPFMYVQVADGDLFTLAGEIGKQKINLVWVNASDIQNDHFIARDNEGNQWRIWMTNDMTRCDLDHAYDGIWVQYYGAAHELSEKDAPIQYEVTALACWRYVTNTAESNEHYQWPCYDYCRYDVDNDGNVEECIISMGHTSGLFTIHYSVWQDGECEDEKLLYTNHALGFAFDTDENGLFILSSEGDRIYPGLYSNGIKH